MAIAVETPAREDLSFRTNDDKRIGARWLKSDGLTPVVIDSAAMSMRLQPAAAAHPEHPIVVPPELVTIASTTPGNPGGWIDPTMLASGIVLVQVPHDVWDDLEGRVGSWELIAVGEGMQRCLVRGVLVVEDGVVG